MILPKIVASGSGNMNQNIQYYNSHAEDFFKTTVNADMAEQRHAFLKYLPEHGSILDAGCGSGRDAKAFLEAGYKVSAFDASIELCRMASKLTGIEVRMLTFQELREKDQYDGVWSCASLLHVPERELPAVFSNLAVALHENGILYASFKKGDGEKIRGKRTFTDFTTDKLTSLLSENFKVLETRESLDVRPNRAGEYWVNVIARKR
jgi:2-polyprenyl-3-methyl-5-hydroxy-6-metoxy-1,4-benzoquinol methylase